MKIVLMALALTFVYLGYIGYVEAQTPVAVSDWVYDMDLEDLQSTTTFHTMIQTTNVTQYSSSCYFSSPTDVYKEFIYNDWNSTVVPYIQLGAQNTTEPCIIFFMEINQPPIPDDINVQKVELLADITDMNGNGLNCDISMITSRGVDAFNPDVIWTGATGGAGGIEYVTNDPGCAITNATDTGTNQTYSIQRVTWDLGPAYATIVESFISTGSSNRIDIGLSFTTMSRPDNATHRVYFDNMVMRIHGEQPPNPVASAGAIIDPWVGLDLTWFPGEEPDTTVSYYDIERYNGATWDTFYSASGVNVTDTTPRQAPENNYRITPYNSLDRGHCSVPFMPTELRDSLEGYWTGCFSLEDSSNNVFPPLEVGAVNRDTGYAVIGGDVWFDFGSSDGSPFDEFDEVDSARNYNTTLITNLQFNNTDAYSIAGWLQSSNMSDGTDTVVGRVQNAFSLGGGEAGENSFTKLRCNSSGDLNYLIRGPLAAKQLTGTGTQLCDNQPHFAVGTFDGSANSLGMSLYMDGELLLVGGDSAFIEDTTTNGTLNIGGHNSGAWQNSFEGYGRDFMAFSKELNQTEVSHLYNATTPTLFPTTSPSDLGAEIIDLDTTRLTFTVPSPLGVLQPVCYAVNYTTPLGLPTTEATACVFSTGTIIINDLNNFDNNYSFRIATNNLAQIVGNSPIANTTSFDPLEVGSIDTPTGVNPDILPIQFTEYVTGNTTILEVSYDDTWDLSCDFELVYGGTNQTYSNLTEVPQGNNKVASNFTLNDPENELINVTCWDENDSLNEGRYVMDQTIIPIFTQIQDFQDGLVGTTGWFGFFDFATLIVVIVSMIGFNRYNPALGVLVMVMMMGTLTYYQVIAWQSSLIGVSALILMLAIIQVRKP